MIVTMTLQVTLTLPDGSASLDGSNGRGWVLPNGDWVKVFSTLERNDEEDLAYHQILGMRCDIDDFVTSAEIGE